MTDSRKQIEPKFDWSKPQDAWEFRVMLPTRSGERVAPSVGGPTCRGRIVSYIGERSLKRNEHTVLVFGVPASVDWIEDFEHAICAFDEKGTSLIWLRCSTPGEERMARIPSFIQNDEWPVCCGRSMCFVGQIDDECLCEDPPPGAKLWWHDAASFYVFTCAVCLECKATGQQY